MSHAVANHPSLTAKSEAADLRVGFLLLGRPILCCRLSFLYSYQDCMLQCWPLSPLPDQTPFIPLSLCKPATFAHLYETLFCGLVPAVENHSQMGKLTLVAKNDFTPID
ncbi:uncharacterized protein Asalp_29930 [Aeromonas salmonicida subsp. pectinolytica 34mel]|uniref:Uncharacterized protein n=1 Tax=Aeromonas salmonicida subsp. pectinolytica 34mel TaxID=1324960 RepID=A0A2D1QIR4_AERSA|nr:uncharacterized protein Asalp_29930 [Aeromonas salmonicida subsp. pectinolytica 34mel]